MSEPFKAGDRVRISEKGHQWGIQRQSDPNRLGTITGHPELARNGCVQVKWDGNKASSSINASFVAKVTE